MMQALDAPTTLVLSWMLTYLIHSTILILGVWLLVRGIKPIAKRLSPRTANLGWKLALTGGLVTATVQIAAGVTPVLGALELETGAPELASTATATPAATQTQPRRIVIQRSAPAPLRNDAADDEVVMLGVGPAGAGPVVGAGLGPQPELQTLPKSASTTRAGEAAPLWPKLVLGAWLLGTLIALARLLGSVVALRRRLKDRSEVIVDPVLESFLTLCRDADVRRKIRLTQSANIDSPIALWRKEVVVPERAVDELSPAAMRSVLAHELAHLERRDPHWLAFAAVLEALLLFQPLNRLARRGMQESAELLCDDWAIAQTGDGVQFAKSLAELASWTKRQHGPALVATMISGERPLVRRVRRALDGDPRRFDDRPRPTRVLLGLATLCGLIMIAPGAVDASPPKAKKAAKGDADKETRAERKARKQREKLEREAQKAAAKAQKAEQEAQKALEEAERARLEAERRAAEARRSATMGGAELGAGVSGQHLIIRDGDEYLIIDEQGMRMRSDEADIVIIDGQNPRMRVRIHDGETDMDLDVDLDTIEGIIGGLLGEELGGLGGLEELGGLGGFMPPMPPPSPPNPGVRGPQHVPPGFDGDIEDIEAWAEEMEAWAEGIEREVEGRAHERDRDIEERAIDREIEERMRELERQQRELERLQERRERSRAPRAPRPPRAPRAPAGAPPAPATAPLIPA